jgi:hypothetical protein
MGTNHMFNPILNSKAKYDLFNAYTTLLIYISSFRPSVFIPSLIPVDHPKIFSNLVSISQRYSRIFVYSVLWKLTNIQISV